MSATVQDVLERAARVIERDGWSQGDFGRGRNPHCLIGAIDCALDDMPPRGRGELYQKSVEVVRDRIGAADYEASGSLISWNDDPRRTRSEVLALLRGTR